MWRDPGAHSRILAVLGPTNTGKTHFAVERMLAYDSGCMGFPLRLLAREIYDRIRAIKGEERVALVTGEERVGRADAPYVVATVEAMPLHRRFTFLAVDEIQLCADAERGHIFTDRLLHARGRVETIFLGADTIRPLLKRLLPRAEVISRPRFSTLRYAGAARLDRLPRRSAVVAFTANDVYAIAEVLRRKKGGAAVVLGALSPRTRNAQVAMYQAGDVDYLVATDAIGMGLNMDLAHVAFASLRKFDGKRVRPLTAPELAQIAGRAGRHMADGTFGVTNGLADLDLHLVEAVEAHRFEPLRQLRWRNAALDFSSLDALIQSLDAPPPAEGLLKVRDALDDRSLVLLARRPEIRERADRPERVRLLWEVCQIPDYRKTLTDAHLHLLATVFAQLTGPRGRLARDWVARRIAQLDRTDGDIDTLSTRIAFIRTWTYLSHRSEWMEDAAEFQERTRAVEDRLSDALHHRLTQRFVDLRTTALLRRWREAGTVAGEVECDGTLRVDGHRVGRLEGLRFRPEPAEGDLERRLLMRTARALLREELQRRVRAILDGPDDQLVVEGRRLLWQGVPIALIVKGSDPLSPQLELLGGQELPSPQTARLKARLQRRLERELEVVLAPLAALHRLSEASELSGAARGILYQLVEGLGGVEREQVAALLCELTPEERRRLRELGLRFGRLQLYHRRLVRGRALAVRATLLSWWTGRALAPPGPRTVLRGSAAREDPALLVALGFVPVDTFALRVDIAERLLAALLARARGEGRFALPLDLAARAGLSRRELETVLWRWGFVAERLEGGVRYRLKRARAWKRRGPAGRHAALGARTAMG